MREHVHRRRQPFPPASYGYLLPNGNLFYNGKTRDNIENVPWWFKIPWLGPTGFARTA